MRNSLCVALLLFASRVPLNAQITSNGSATNIKSSFSQPVVITPEEKQAFEVSIQSQWRNVTQTGGPTVVLAWSPLRTATHYTVLRSSTMTGPWISIPLGDALNYDAHVLYRPYNFYFRVVALNAKNEVLDTTSSTMVVAPGNQADDQHEALFITQCNLIVPSGINLEWRKPSGIDDAVVRLFFMDYRQAVVSTSQTAGTTYSVTGLAAGTYKVEVQFRYTIQDYPVAGQSTSQIVGHQSKAAVLPVSASSPCT